MNFFDLLLAKKLGGGGGGITPTGTIEISENGQYDVTQYAEANVNVQGGGGGGFTETLLWENPDSGAQMALTQFDGIKMNDLAEYDYMKIVWVNAVRDANERDGYWSIPPFLVAATTTKSIICIADNAGTYGRCFGRIANADGEYVLCCTTGLRLNGSGNSATACIPLRIYGVKSN